MTMPPSVELWPAALWPPLRTASSMPRLARDRDDGRDVRGVGDPDDRRRPGFGPGGHDRSSGVVVGVVRGDDAAADGVAHCSTEQGLGRYGEMVSSCVRLPGQAHLLSLVNATLYAYARSRGTVVGGVEMGVECER